MKPSKITALIIGVIIQINLAVKASGATYFVMPSGDNANPGTAALPWKTIQKAANTVLPGDTVEVGGGDYGELVDLSRNAAPGQPITFRSNGAETGGFNCRKSDYIIQGFRLNGTNDSMVGTSALVYVYEGAHRLRIFDNYFHDATNKYAIFLGLATGGILTNSSSFCLVSNNAFVAINYINVFCDGISNQFLNNVFKDGNGQSDCFRLWGEGHIAADNLVTNVSNIVENHTDFFQVFGPNPARNQGDFNFVRNIVLERNFVINSRIQICQLETFDNPPGNMTNLIFRNNVFVNLPYAANVDMDGTKWFNNLFFRVNTGNGGHVFALGGPKGSAYGTEIKNNIFFECGNGSTSVGWYQAVGQISGIVNFDINADYNFVCGPGFAPKSTAAPFGWGQQGQEAHGINGGNPGFISAATSDFRLVSSSILIDAAIPIPGYSDDLLRQVRSGARWDVGPYEFQNPVRPLPPRNLRVNGVQ